MGVCGRVFAPPRAAAAISRPRLSTVTARAAQGRLSRVPASSGTPKASSVGVRLAPVSATTNVSNPANTISTRAPAPPDTSDPMVREDGLRPYPLRSTEVSVHRPPITASSTPAASETIRNGICSCRMPVAKGSTPEDGATAVTNGIGAIDPTQASCTSAVGSSRKAAVTSRMQAWDRSTPWPVCSTCTH